MSKETKSGFKEGIEPKLPKKLEGVTAQEVLDLVMETATNAGMRFERPVLSTASRGGEHDDGNTDEGSDHVENDIAEGGLSRVAKILASWAAAIFIAIKFSVPLVGLPLGPGVIAGLFLLYGLYKIFR